MSNFVFLVLWFCFWSLSPCYTADPVRTLLWEGVSNVMQILVGSGHARRPDTEMANIRKLQSFNL